MNWRETFFFLVIAVGTVSIIVSVLWILLARKLKPESFQERKDFIQLIAQILGGATIIITLFSTWYSVRENERKTEQSAAAARDNLRIAVETLKETRNKQIAERYSRAAEQLGSADHKFRVGAIYALQQVANESDEFYPSVVEVLTSYIAENARWQNAKRPADQMPADIQAAFNVLAWRKRTYEKGEDRRLELHGVDLRGLILKNKEGVEDGGAHFEGAQLWNSHFEGGTTNLRYIHLENAVLKNANLQGAYLFGAFLQGADLTDANIDGADLSFAQITPQQVAEADNYACAKYDPKFQQELEEYKKKGGEQVLNDYLSKKRTCIKTEEK